MGYHKIKLEDEISKSMRFDFEILCDVMVRFGHTVVDINYGNGRKWVDVIQWAEDYCVGSYKEHMGKWLFELEQDAVLFKLKWL